MCRYIYIRDHRIVIWLMYERLLWVQHIYKHNRCVFCYVRPSAFSKSHISMVVHIPLNKILLRATYEVIIIDPYRVSLGEVEFEDFASGRSRSLGKLRSNFVFTKFKPKFRLKLNGSEQSLYSEKRSSPYKTSVIFVITKLTS